MPETKFTPADKLKEDIENALYSTNHFLTSKCEELREVIETVPMIAQAPAMFEALKRMVNIFHRDLPEHSIGFDACEKAKKILAAARGESK